MTAFSVTKQPVGEDCEISSVRNAYSQKVWVFVYDARAHDYVVLPNGEILDMSVEDPGSARYPEYREAYQALQDSF